MPFKRAWDSSCPRVWDQWRDHGVTWTIQDLPPEDDKLAVDLLVENFLSDEVLCASVNVLSNPESIQGSREYWASALAQRTSLACYREERGAKTLAAFNVCPVMCVDDTHDETEVRGEEWRQVIGVLHYIDDKLHAFKALNVDKYLAGAGLLVTRKYRGEGLGTKLLLAREPLCLSLGIHATVTVFTGPASQKSAVKAGFTSLLDVTLAEIARSGLRYPVDEKRVLKLMAKKFQAT